MQVPRKAVAAGLAGALTVVLVWVLRLAHVEMPPDVASAVTTIFSACGAYLIRGESA